MLRVECWQLVVLHYGRFHKDEAATLAAEACECLK